MVRSFHSPPAIGTVLVLCLWGGVTACSGNQTLEDRFAANPALQPESVNQPDEPLPSPTPETESNRPAITTSPTAPPREETNATHQPFTDLGELPDSLRQPIADLAKLGLIRAKTAQTFAPQTAITRAEFARWLWQVNNRFHADQPSKQIRPATPQAQPIFTDVPASHPDFRMIQGLAEAGIIPSKLTNDPSATLFRPNAPLTRETLLRWKVPLDHRSALPKSTLENLKETWGFQDMAKITPNAFPALYTDFQSGDRANIRRMFGYITLFQPQKPVTRAEAAAAVSYLGSALEGISATEVLNRPSSSSPQPSPSPVDQPQ